MYRSYVVIVCMQAKVLFTEVETLCPQNAFVFLHRAELEIHSNQFSEAISMLRKAKRLTVYNSRSATKTIESKAATHKMGKSQSNLKSLSHTQKKVALAASQQSIQSHVERTQRSQNQLQASIYSLLGVAIFRQNPTRPDVSPLYACAHV